MIFMAYGQYGIDCAGITAEAFSVTRQRWSRLDHPITFVRQEAVRLADRAAKGRQPTPEAMKASIDEMLGELATPGIRAALQAIDGLPPKTRLAFLCDKVFALPREQAAALVGCSGEVLRVHLANAKKWLTDREVDYPGLEGFLDGLGGNS